MLRCTSAFHCTIDGADRFVPADAIVSPSDPVVTGRESLFAPVDQVDAEQPTGRRAAKPRG